ncbi:cell division protein FtsZ [Telmatospirillum siberiense]|uniref:Cell division protein FtsZ n=1 Tax=Telmatospirillum siberiense TaxID=382514 RepID=A0A2N3PQN3_9PROT|nr:cell division protein FtsZ [Telmatospirillum siberiense]PKU22694.1 cell division protein FtsZ [Telmatospirillum siberiense]
MINFHPSNTGELKPRITVIGVGGAGGNAVNNMIQSHLEGVEFIVANTDAQAMAQSRTDRRIQLGSNVTQGLGAGARPDIGRAAAEETLDEIISQMQGSNMVFITAGMGGGTGTGAAPVIARAAREHGILTVGVVTKPFNFEGQHRMRLADSGIEELSQYVDTLIIIPNQNLFRIASERTTFADAFKMADDVLYSGVRGVTDLMIMPGLINLDFADIRTVMSEMGKAMMGTGEAEGEKRALEAAEAAINNPLLEDISMKGARGVLINITGGLDMTLFEVDEAANRIRDEVDPDANIIFGSTFDEKLEGKMRVSVVATGIESAEQTQTRPTLISLVDQKRQPAAIQPAAKAAGLTLAERVAGTAPMFHGTAAIAQPDLEEELDAAIGGPRQEDERYQSEPSLSVRSEPAPEPTYAPRAEAAPSQRMEPTMSVRHETPARAEPAQGSLHIESPAPRMEPRADLRPSAPAASYAQVAQRAQADAAEPVPEQHRRSGFLNRLAGHVKTASHVHASATQPAHRPAAPEPQADRQQPVAQPTRISPADRLPTSRNDEDLLEIPAFLRRQAN